MGIGIDTSTGLLLREGTLIESVFGLYTVTILDAETYHAAQNVHYAEPNNLISLRNVLVQLLSAGNMSYDLQNRVNASAAPAVKVERTFDDLSIPDGSAPLVFAGRLDLNQPNNPVIEHFQQISGGNQARYLIVAAGFPSSNSAQIAVDQYADSFGSTNTQVRYLNPLTQTPGFPAPTAYDAVILFTLDQALLQPILPEIKISSSKHGKPENPSWQMALLLLCLVHTFQHPVISPTLVKSLSNHYSVHSHNNIHSSLEEQTW